MTADRVELVEMERSECMRLLREHAVGRLAVVVADRPLVFPVNYMLDDDAIVFRTDEGTKLYGATRGHHVAFEIDGFDAVYHEGWSVLAVGLAHEVTDGSDQARLASLPLTAWGPGPKSHWVQIRPTAVTGRRLVRQSTRIQEETP